MTEREERTTEVLKIESKGYAERRKGSHRNTHTHEKVALKPRFPRLRGLESTRLVSKRLKQTEDEGSPNIVRVQRPTEEASSPH